MPPHDVPAVHHIKQVLEMVPKGMEVILLGDLNIRLREPREDREDELATALAGIGLMDVAAHFTPRRRYRGTGNWTWKMRQEGSMVTGRGDCILSSDRYDFAKAGVQEARLHMDHRMVLVVL